MLGGCPAIKDSCKRNTLARMCIGLAQLCTRITEVLSVQYSTLGHKIGATQETTMRLVPKKSAAESADVLRCDDAFAQWQRELPQDLHYFAPESREPRTTNDGEVIHLHRALLSGIYLTAVSALHRPQILPSAPHVVVAPALRELSKKKVRDAADDITEMYKELFAHDMIRYLPNTGVTCLLPAIIIHLLDIKSTDSNIRQASVRKFHFCMQSLQRLREMYASADFAFSFLDAAVRKQNAQVSAAVATGDGTNSPISPKPPKSVDQTSAHGLLLLTPPPEAMQTASLLLLNATLAPEERNLIAAYAPRTPAGSDISLSAHSTAGAAVALTDVPEKYTSKIIEVSHPSDAAQFESLIDLEGGADLFASVEDDMDLSMQWLQGFDADKLGPGMGDPALENLEEADAWLC